VLSVDQLRGVFAAAPIPWDDSDVFNEAIFREDVARLCASGIHGIYTTGSTGEFYALDFDEFRHIVDAFVEEARPSAVLTQVGCTATCSRHAARMARYAADKGVDAVQIALPFWLAVSDKEMVAFFQEVATACAGLPLIHYNSLRSKRFLGTREYCILRDAVPTLVGTKFTGSDLFLLTNLLLNLPDMAHFVGEHILAAGTMLGARGCYSSFALMNPAFMLRFWNLCEQRQWTEAALLQRDVALLMINGSRDLRASGCQDAAIDKARAAVTGFLKCPLRVREPYTSATNAQVLELRRYVQQHTPRLLVGPGNGSTVALGLPSSHNQQDNVPPQRRKP
jgi:dihydrodipicolinate synthase/N-acetylneuraminate lyase